MNNTINDMSAEFLASIDGTDATRETYGRNLDKFIGWADAEGLDIIQAGKADTQRYKQHLINLGYKPSTVNVRLASVRAWYAWAEDKGIYAGNAGAVHGVKKGHAQAKRALTRDEVADTLDTVKGEGAQAKRDYAIMLLMATRGLRTIEITRANIGHMDRTQGKTLLWVQGKGRADASEYVVLSEQLTDAITDYLEAAGRTCAEPSEPLFTSTSNRNSGKRLTTRTIRNIAERAFDAAGIKSGKVTAHSLRHTAVTMALQGGASVQEAQGLARHADINTTLIYAHNIERLEGRAEAAIDGYLSGKTDGAKNHTNRLQHLPGKKMNGREKTLENRSVYTQKPTARIYNINTGACKTDSACI